MVARARYYVLSAIALSAFGRKEGKHKRKHEGGLTGNVPAR